jgi:hypothetical protein
MPVSPVTGTNSSLVPRSGVATWSVVANVASMRPPSCTVTADTYWPCISSGEGNPAAALLDGSLPVVWKDSPTAVLAPSASDDQKSNCAREP